MKATFTAPGTYLLRVMAHDGGLISTQDVTVTVQPRPSSSSSARHRRAATYRIALRGRKGRLPGLTPPELQRQACAQGFREGCR